MAAASCKRFKGIFSGPTLMSTFKLTLNFDREDLPTSDTLTRKYQVVVFKNLTSPRNFTRSNAFRALFRHLGPSIKFLKFVMCTISDIWISRLLTRCPNVTTLKFKNCVILGSDQPAKEVNLPMLKKFKLFNTPCANIVQFIKDVTTLETVQIATFPGMMDLEDLLELGDVDGLKAIICRQKSLKMLAITDVHFFATPFTNCEFQLESLELSTIVATQNQMDSIRDFLASQKIIKRCIFNIAEYAVGQLSSESYIQAMKYIMTLKSLKQLRLVAFTQTAMQAIIEEDFSNPNITELELLAHRIDHAYRRVVEAVARKFANLCKLRFAIDNCWLEPYNALERTFEPLSTLRHLKELTLEHFESHLVGRIKIPQLQSLLLIDLKASKRSHWIKFFGNNPSIQHLVILETADVPKHSLIHLIETAVMHLDELETVRICASCFGSGTFRELVEFIGDHGGPMFRSLRVCNNSACF